MSIVPKMAEVIGRKADTSGLSLETVDILGNREIQGVIVFAGHTMKIENGWKNCGVCWESVSCNCGFESGWFSGNGCWQQGHNGPAIEHSFDLLHNAMYLVAEGWKKKQPRLQRPKYKKVRVVD